MLFRRDIEPCCAYCQHGEALNEEESVCKKRGVTALDYSCSAFKYDPLKREPPRSALLKTDGLSEKDFSID